MKYGLYFTIHRICCGSRNVLYIRNPGWLGQGPCLSHPDRVSRAVPACHRAVLSSSTRRLLPPMMPSAYRAYLGRLRCAYLAANVGHAAPASESTPS